MLSSIANGLAILRPNKLSFSAGSLAAFTVRIGNNQFGKS